MPDEIFGMDTLVVTLSFKFHQSFIYTCPIYRKIAAPLSQMRSECGYNGVIWRNGKS